MSAHGAAHERPQGSRETLVYEIMVHAWGRVVLEAASANPFALADTLAPVHHITPERMLDLNWEAYREINEIADFAGTLEL